MRLKMLLVVLLSFMAMTGQERPRGISVYTWTREDLFAGLLAKDFQQLQVGMQKLDHILQQTPKNPDALAMKGFGLAVLAVKSHEEKDRAGFDRQYQEAVRLLDEAYATAPSNIGVLAVYGATMVMLGPRFPPELQRPSIEKGKVLYEKLYKLQETQIDKYPPHLKGEVLGGLADVEHLLGNTAQSRAYLTRIIESMPGTSYETRAKQWLSNPPQKVTARNRMLCLTCHEPGRLKPRLAALQQTSQQ